MNLIMSGAIQHDRSLRMQAIFNGDHPDHFTESFRLLKKYIEESLDQYKEELQQVLFPMFVHLFLQMVHAGHLTQAR
jgi:transcription initiation factor TFIID subunit 5